jgi:ADP-ribose pyrophosphatase
MAEANETGGPVVEAIEVVEDRSDRARCDEGFLRVRRLVCRNLRSDGSRSVAYPVDVVDRAGLDAVAVVLWRRDPDSGRVALLVRQNLRPAAYFRREKQPAVADPREYRRVPEIVAGVLEPGDRGEAGLKSRAAAEALEEAGYPVVPEAVVLLGAPFFVAPGILSEKIFLAAADVGDLEARPPPGDGSPLEEGGRLEWVDIDEVLRRCLTGEIEDAKTELGARRLKDRLLGGGAALLAG